MLYATFMFSNFRLWWQKPQLHQPGDDNGKVTFLELFYDLIFVVVISRLAHRLAAHPSPQAFLDFVLLFIPVWWVWLSIAYYNERFETYDLSFRAFTFLQMLPVAGMAVTAEYGLSKTATGFALSYAAARVLITFMWWRAGRHNPQVRPVTDVYVRGFALSIVLWVVAAFLVGPLAYALKAAGLLIELLTPILTLQAQREVFRARVRKLPERFGLFVIIVLGETLVGVLNGLADLDGLNLAVVWRFILGFTLGFGLWWVWFDYLGRREPDSLDRWGFLRWTYGHLPLVIGITVIGAMVEHGVALEEDLNLAAVRWLMAGGFALFYLACAVIETGLEPEKPPMIPPRLLIALRLGTAAVALLLPLLALPLTGLMAVLIGLHLLHAGLGVRAWFASSNAGRVDVH